MRKDQFLFFKYSKLWSFKVLKLAGINVQITGNNELNPNDIYVFVANHSSMLDIPLLLGYLPGNVAIIYKQELEKIPVFGKSLERSPFIGINRSNPRASMESIKKAVESIHSGISVIIFPEGTRSLDGSLIEFKRGAFMLAARSGKPIVPVTIKGSSKLLPSGKFKFSGGKIEIHFSNIINNRTSSPLEEKKLMKEVQRIIQDELEK